jgi:hypothetical protein
MRSHHAVQAPCDIIGVLKNNNDVVVIVLSSAQLVSHASQSKLQKPKDFAKTDFSKLRRVTDYSFNLNCSPSGTLSLTIKGIFIDAEQKTNT